MTVTAFTTNLLNAHPVFETVYFNAPAYAQTYWPRRIGLSVAWRSARD